MFTMFKLLAITLIISANPSKASEDIALYYYGLEESEYGLPWCDVRQACSTLVSRPWRRPALTRLCRCERRQRCDTPARADRIFELNNLATMQFCKPIIDIPECAYNETALLVETVHDRMNPDDIETKHHNNVNLTPPKITMNCRCRIPNYWRRMSQQNTKSSYKCSSLPLCKSADFCGNVDDDFALYQSCLCPKGHICVHNGGIPHIQISELLYRGVGWKAYCQLFKNDNDSADYEY